MAGPVDLQADVGNLGLAGLNSFRGLLAALSTDDVQPGAILQLQDIGSLFHASGPFASRVADELQRFSSYRKEKLAVAVGWRRNDAVSLLAQSAGGQAVALLALFLENTHEHDKVGEILYRFSTESLPKERSIASMKQLAEVSSKVSCKLGSMGYGNFLAEQVTTLRLTYLSSNLPAPTCLLDALTEQATMEILDAISRAQRETNVCARITGARGVGHIMALLRLLCANDVEIAVENTIIHSGGNRCIFLNVLAASHLNHNCGCPPTSVRLETVLKLIHSVQLPIYSFPSDGRQLAYLWKGWLAARLEMVMARHWSVKRQDLAEDCCNFIWNMFQLETTSRAWAALGTSPYLRIQKALMTMFDAHTWVPQKKDLKICLEDMISLLAFGLNCSNCHTHMLPQLWRWITGESSDFSGKEPDSSGDEPDSSGEEPELCGVERGPCCSLLDRLFWREIFEIFIQGFAGLYIDPSPKATVVMPPEEFTEHSISLYLELPWTYWFADTSLRNSRLLGGCNGSSVLYPTLLHQLEMPLLFHVQYQIADGCFMLNGRYFQRLEAEWATTYHRPPTSVESLDIIRPIYLGPHETCDLTVSESFSELKLWLRINMDNRIEELNLARICSGYQNNLKFTTPCDHSPAIPLENSLMRYVTITSNIFADPKPPYPGGILLYMMHKNRQMQFFCSGFATPGGVVIIIYMQDCCLNCAVQQALKYNDKRVGIIVS
ncbi:MAG: hypothetical protein LQ338_003975 [Usnochroma carphineum]|nr:MAG: hypothetical protein LQ338_003975 [Usnochroma carphineum]